MKTLYYVMFLMLYLYRDTLWNSDKSCRDRMRSCITFDSKYINIGQGVTHSETDAVMKTMTRHLN